MLALLGTRLLPHHILIIVRYLGFLRLFSRHELLDLHELPVISDVDFLTEEALHIPWQGLLLDHFVRLLRFRAWHSGRRTAAIDA